MDRNRYYLRFVLIAALLTVGLLAGCETAAQFFTPGPDGSPSPADQFAVGVGAAAPAFGPYGVLATTVAGGVAAIGGWIARNRGKKLKKIGPAFAGVATAIDEWKAENPDAWESLAEMLNEFLDEDDDDVVDHFRPFKPDSKALKGVQ